MESLEGLEEHLGGLGRHRELSERVGGHISEGARGIYSRRIPEAISGRIHGGIFEESLGRFTSGFLEDIFGNTFRKESIQGFLKQFLKKIQDESPEKKFE